MKVPRPNVKIKKYFHGEGVFRPDASCQGRLESGTDPERVDYVGLPIDRWTRLGPREVAWPPGSNCFRSILPFVGAAAGKDARPHEVT